MTFAGLAIRSAFRNRLRTVLTAFGVGIAIVAFLFLRAVIGSYYAGAEAASSDRMVVRSRVSITQPLPLAYRDKIAGVAGVSAVSWGNWFGGVYIDEKNFFAQFAVDPASWLAAYPELILEADARQAWLDDRRGAIVGERLADKFGWKVGDKVTLRGDIYPGNWDFTVRGIYRGRDRSTDVQTMYFHWKYLDENIDAEMKNLVGIFVIGIADAARSAQIAQAVDALFANSADETRTETEKAFQMSFLSMAGTIITAIQWISAVMLAILVLILGNTMAMSTRERTTEYAVMRAVRVRPHNIMGLVLGEGLVVAAVGFGLGVLLSGPVLQGFADIGQSQFGNFLGQFGSSGSALGLAAAASLLGGLLATGLPALRASRLPIVESLRKVE